MNQRQHLSSVDDLQTLLKQQKILQQFAISRLGVFGSFARNEPAQDIDLLIEDNVSLETAFFHRSSFDKLRTNGERLQDTKNLQTKDE